MNIGSTNQVSVTSAGVKIIAMNADISTRRAVIITNTSASTTVWIGQAGVTTSTGHYLGAGQSISIPATCDIWGIVASTAVTVTFIELVDH